jgi:hypothetical protein
LIARQPDLIDLRLRWQVARHRHQHGGGTLDQEGLLLLSCGAAGTGIAAQEPSHQRVVGWRLEPLDRVAAGDRDQPPAQRRQGQTDRRTIGAVGIAERGRARLRRV